MTETFPFASSARPLARIMQSMVIRTAVRRERRMSNTYQLIRVNHEFCSLLHYVLTDNSCGSINYFPRGLSWDVPVRAEKQLEREGLSKRCLVHFSAVLVTAVPSIDGHLLSFHQFHQLLHLAGGVQGAGLVPVYGGVG